MSLPHYFFADLPHEATITPTMLTEACLTLRRNRERYLANRTTKSLISLLSWVAAEWLKPEYSFRKMALAEGPETTGFSMPTLEAGLTDFFRQVNERNLIALIEQDLGHAHRLDALVSTEVEERQNRMAIATAPGLLVHVAAGNLPNPTLMSMILGLLARSAQFVKCASGSAFLPRLFAHSLYEADSKIGACLEVAEWKRPAAGALAASPQGAASEQLKPVETARALQPAASPGAPVRVRLTKPAGANGFHTTDLQALELNRALFQQADCVTATGDDESLANIRQQMPLHVRFVGYGHRVSFGFIAAGALTSSTSHRLVENVAADVCAWNQLGCLSPHIFYVEHGGILTPAQFAERLAKEMPVHEHRNPRGDLPVQAAAEITSRRSIYEVRAAHSEETQIWASKDSTAWTVVFEMDPRFQVSCLNRFIYVKGVANLAEALRAADMVRGKVSTVGLAAPHREFPELATQLARWGATRVCPLGRMQRPSLSWRHDGRPALGDIVMWTDVELD
jgi:hypothetical protein